MVKKKEDKSILKSKTFWANIVISSPMIINVVAENEMLNINPGYYAILALVVNVYLRSVTTGGVSTSLSKNKK